MPELKVRITTVGELAGAKAVEAQLERQIGQAKALGREYQELEARLSNARKMTASYADTTTTAAKAADKAGAAAGGFGASMGKLWGGLKLVANILPGFGVAGLVGLAIEGFQRWVLQTGALKEEMEAVKKALDDMHQATVKAKIESAEYQASLKQIGTDAGTAADKLKAMNDEIDRQKSQEQQLLDREKAVEMAEAGGIADPVDRKKREFEIEEKYAGKRATLERQVIQKRMDAEESAYQQALRDREYFASKVAESEGIIGGLGPQQAVAGDRAKTEREKAAKLRAKADEVGELIDLLERRTGRKVDPGSDIGREAASRYGAAAEQERIARLTEENQIALARQMAEERARLAAYRKGGQATGEFLAGEEVNRMPRWEWYKSQLDFINRLTGLDTKARRVRFGTEIDDLRARQAEAEARNRSKPGKDDSEALWRDVHQGGGVNFSRVAETNQGVTAALSDLARAMAGQNMDQAAIIREVIRQIEQGKSQNKHSGRMR